VVAEMSLRRWTNAGLERVRKAEIIAEIFLFGVKLRGEVWGAEEARDRADGNLEMLRA